MSTYLHVYTASHQCPGQVGLLQSWRGWGYASSLLCRIARPPRSRPARKDTSCRVPAVHFHAPGRRALHCLQDSFRRSGGLPMRTRSLLDLSRLLQRKKQKAHQAAAAWSKLTRFSIMIMQPLRIGLTLSTPASLPFRSISKSAKAVFAFQSPIPMGNNGSVPISHTAFRKKSKHPAFAALHHCRHCRSCRFGNI
jgi:hypothetical protein